jgi:shikimate kinase
MLIKVQDIVESGGTQGISNLPTSGPILPARIKKPSSALTGTPSLRTTYTHRIINTASRLEHSQGNASAPCCLSIFSAYANDIGACIALGERIEVIAQLAEALEGEFFPPTMLSGDKYLRSCVEQACTTAGRPLPSYLSLQISSGVPAGNGIKTSSALGASLTAAMFDALNVSTNASVVVNTSSDAARKGGVTQAGSVDDTWASVRGGVVVTEGSTRELLASWPAPETVEVVIFIPARRRPLVHFLDRRAIMASHKRDFDLLLSRLLNSGDRVAGMYSVMSDAAFITARAFDYPTAPLAIALQNGALGVSLSGKGPAMGAITEPQTTEQVIAAWQQYPGRIIRTRPDNVGLQTVDCSAPLFSKVAKEPRGFLCKEGRQK